MSDEPVSDVPQDPGFPEHAAGPKAKKRLLPISRIVLIVVVIATAVLAFFELRPRLARDASYRALDAAINEALSTPEGLSRKDLDKYLQGTYQHRVEEGESVMTGETIVWNGLLMEYRVVVQYRGKKGESLSYVTMD